jgi:orotate phosphoribosyltransferase
MSVPVKAADVLQLLPMRRGHFRFESGHHGETWIDLELLCVRAAPVERLAGELAERLAPHRPEVICGPLVEGAFVALMVASRMRLPFTYAERFAGAEGLFPVRYRLPRPQLPLVKGRRVAIVNDATNAGSAVRGTYFDLLEQGGQPVVIGSLAVFGDGARQFSAERGLALEALSEFPNQIWTPDDCPLCERNVPLQDPTA